MKNKNIILISFILLILISSCSKKEITDKNIKTIKANSTEKILASSFLDSITYIPLDSKDIVGRISNLMYSNGRYYVLDPVSKTINIFDDKGKSLFEIAAVGRGPGEYTEITDFYVNNKYIVVLCRTLKKIIRYSLDGQPLDEQVIKDYLNAIRPIDSGYLTYSTEGDEIGLNGRAPGIGELQIKTDLTDTSLRTFGGNYAAYVCSQSKYFTEGINDSFLLLNPSDTVYSYEENHIKAKYFLDFGEKNIPEKYKKLKSDPQNLATLRNNGYITYKDFLVETSNFVFFSFSVGQDPNFKFLIQDNTTDKSFYSHILINDISSSLPYTAPYYKKDNENVVSILNPEIFQSYLSALETNKQNIIKAAGEKQFNNYKKELERFAKNNNPILAIGHLKKINRK